MDYRQHKALTLRASARLEGIMNFKPFELDTDSALIAAVVALQSIDMCLDMWVKMWSDHVHTFRCTNIMCSDMYINVDRLTVARSTEWMCCTHSDSGGSVGIRHVAYVQCGSHRVYGHVYTQVYRQAYRHVHGLQTCAYI